MCSAWAIWRRGADKSNTNALGLGSHVWPGTHTFSADTQHSGHGCPSARVSLHSAAEINKTWLWPPNCDTVHGRMNNIVFLAVVGPQALIERLPMSCTKLDPSYSSDAAAPLPLYSPTRACLEPNVQVVIPSRASPRLLMIGTFAFVAPLVATIPTLGS